MGEVTGAVVGDFAGVIGCSSGRFFPGTPGRLSSSSP